jgi:hypothetical protein
VLVAGYTVTVWGCVAGPPGCFAGATSAGAFTAVGGLAIAAVGTGYAIFKESMYGCGGELYYDYAVFPGQPAGSNAYVVGTIDCNSMASTMSMVVKFFENGTQYYSDTHYCSSGARCTGSWAVAGMAVGKCYWATMDWAAFFAAGSESGRATSRRVSPQANGTWHVC